MPNRFLLLLILALQTSALWCAEGVLPDTVNSPVVHVVSSRFPLLLNDKAVPSTFVPSELIKSIHPIQISEILQLVPGVFVKDYGGIGGVKSISVRGGSASQALVLIDGIPLNTAQNGQVDLSMIPASFVRSAEVQRGGSSATEGANALSGVVKFSLLLPDTTQAQIQASGGSFNEWRFNGSASTPLGNDFTLGGSVELLGTSGSYPIEVSDGTTGTLVNRTNSDVRNTGVMLRLQNATGFSVDVIGRDVSRGVPGAIVQGSLGTPQARLTETDVLSAVNYAVAVDSMWNVKFIGTARFLKQHYSDPSALWAGSTGINDTYATRDVSVTSVAQYSNTDFLWANTIRGGYIDLRGNNLIDANINTVHRSTISFASAIEQTDGNVGEVRGSASVRADVLSDVGTALSASIGLRDRLSPPIVIRSNWSYNFRPPSFNELYYLNYGTKNLLPERSHTINVGASINALSWIVLDADVFGMFTKNLIVSVPINPVVTSAQNVGTARTLGVELKASANLLPSNALHFVWSYTLQNARDATGRQYVDGTPIPYVPQELINISLFYDDNFLFGNVRWNYAGYRYSQLGGEFTSLLDSYHIVSASVGVHANSTKSKTDVRLQVDNLLNQHFDIVRGFPMPGISGRVVVGISL